MLLPYKCLTYTNYPNDQLQFSLLEMGQVEILGRDRKRSKEKERGQERSISIGTKQHDNNSDYQATLQSQTPANNRHTSITYRYISIFV